MNGQLITSLINHKIFLKKEIIYITPNLMMNLIHFKIKYYLNEISELLLIFILFIFQKT
jgi:hypothetical protein